MHFKTAYELLHYTVANNLLRGFSTNCLGYGEIEFDGALDDEIQQALYDTLHGLGGKFALYGGHYNLELNSKNELICFVSIDCNEGGGTWIEPLNGWIAKCIGLSREEEFSEFHLRLLVPDFKKEKHEVQNFKVVCEDGKVLSQKDLLKMENELIPQLKRHIKDIFRFESHDDCDGYVALFEGDSYVDITKTGERVIDCLVLKEHLIDFKIDPV